MNILNRFSKICLARFHPSAALLPATLLMIGTLLLSVSPALHADELQEATQLFKQGQHNQALSKLNNFLVHKPRDAQGRFLKGLILTGQGKTADAIKVFSALTEDYPELPEPYNNLAVLYASQNQYDKAKSALEMAIRTHPSYATAHENLGDIYAKMASLAYDRALQLDRSNTATQTKLAMIQDLFSDKPHAKSNLTRNAAARTPSPAEALAPTEVIAPAEVSAPVTRPVATLTKAADTAPAKIAAVADNTREVQEAVNAWAAVWSSRNAKKYLSFYATDFKTPDGESRAAWAAIRTDRISQAKHIEVSISDVVVDFTDDTHATVKFHQKYHSNNFKASGNKTLLMVKSGDNWFIQEERTR